MIKRKLNPESGKRLRECLEHDGLTQKGLSNSSGYTPQYISNIIVGKKPLTSSAAEVFAKVLNIRKEYLLCEDNFKTFKERSRHQKDAENMYDLIIMNHLKFCGIGIEFNICLPDGSDLPSPNNDCRFEGTLNDPIHWTVSTSEVTYKNAILKSVNITYNGVVSTISVGDFLNFIDDIEDYITFMVEKLLQKSERQAYNDATNAVIESAINASIKEDFNKLYEKLRKDSDLLK